MIMNHHDGLDFVEEGIISAKCSAVVRGDGKCLENEDVFNRNTVFGGID